MAVFIKLGGAPSFFRLLLMRHDRADRDLKLAWPAAIRPIGGC